MRRQQAAKPAQTGDARRSSNAADAGSRRNGTRPGNDFSLSQLVASPRIEHALRPLADRLLSNVAGAKVIGVSSALPGEGKTLVACSLALMLSNNPDRSVLLVDADIRRPCIHQLLNVEVAPGLAECVREEGRLREVSSRVGNLRVLPSGRNANAAWLLKRTTGKRLVEEMRESFDFTLIDLPPIQAPGDEAVTVSAWVDSVILVVKAGSTSAPAVQKAAGMIDSEKLLGVVLNQERPNLPRWVRKFF